MLERERDAACQTPASEEVAAAKRLEAGLRTRVAEWRKKNSDSHTLKIRNDCQAGPIFAAITFALPERKGADGKDIWVTQGWFKVDPGQTADTEAASFVGRFYIYAEGAGLTWQGEGKPGAVVQGVVNNAFARYGTDAALGDNKRAVSFFLKDYATSGEHVESLTCAK